MRHPAIETLGESALLLRFDAAAGFHAIDIEVNRRVHALAAQLQLQRPGWLREIVPAYASLALQLDLDAFGRVAHDQASHDRDADPLAIAREWAQQAMQAADTRATPFVSNVVDIPVRYGGTDGPDLAALAQHAGLTIAQAIQCHCAMEYTVAMLGFAPGFPYLLGLDPALHMARLATPRTRVPAGSVAIGGAQTGIYPRESPGGWHIIGRTQLLLFDPALEPPTLLQPGDRVRFVALDPAHAVIDATGLASP